MMTLPADLGSCYVRIANLENDLCHMRHLLERTEYVVREQELLLGVFDRTQPARRRYNTVILRKKLRKSR